MFDTLLDRMKRSTLARNAGWLFAGQGISFSVQVLNFVILARLLGPTQYGILAGAAALVNVVSAYSALGSGYVFLRYVSPDHSRFREYWGNIIMATLVIGGLSVLALHLTGRWLIGRESASILAILAIGDCIGQQLLLAAGQVFQTFEQMKYTAFLTLIMNLLRALLALGMYLVLRTATAWQWAFASLWISLAATVVAVIMVTRHFGRPQFAPKLFAARAGEGFIFAMSGSTGAVYNDIDKVMLGHYGMNLANGIYSMAYRVVNIGAMPIVSIFSAAFPRFCRESADGIIYVEPYTRKLLKQTAILGLGIAACMFLFAPIVPHLMGKGFAESVSAVRWLCLIPFFRSFQWSAGDALAGAGHQKFRLIAQAVAAGANFLMNLYLIPHYSWVGAAWASLVTDGALGIMIWVAFLYLCRKNSRELALSGV